MSCAPVKHVLQTGVTGTPIASVATAGAEKSRATWKPQSFSFST